MVEDEVGDFEAVGKERCRLPTAQRTPADAALQRPRVGEFPARSPGCRPWVPRPMRETMTTGEISFRNAWLPVFVDRVDDRTIWRVVVAGIWPPPGVRIAVWEWRARKDSNL